MVQLRVPVTPADHVDGPANASAVLVEYGDYECVHCGLAHPNVAAVRKHFATQLRFVYRHFPLTQVHPNAVPAAETAEFAGAHNRFWTMHDALFANQARLGPGLFIRLAIAFDLPASDLQNDLIAHRFRDKVRNDFLGGVRSGVNGTPAFFINGERHDGGYALADLTHAIETRLSDRAVT